MIDEASQRPAPFGIIVHSFSRFFRDQFQLEFYVRRLAKNGVRLPSITQEHPGPLWSGQRPGIRRGAEITPESSCAVRLSCEGGFCAVSTGRSGGATSRRSCSGPKWERTKS